MAGDFLAIGAVEAVRLFLSRREPGQPEPRRSGDVVTLALVGGLFMGLCVAVEVLARRVRLSPEILRKLVHMSAALFTAMLPLLSRSPRSRRSGSPSPR